MPLVWPYIIGILILTLGALWFRKTKPKRDFLYMCELVTNFKEMQYAVREHTWQSITLDGELMEAIGANVISAIGHGSRGQAPGGNLSNQGDYKNGMECKSSPLRDFPQIEFLLTVDCRITWIIQPICSWYFGIEFRQY